jgi:hypothetical protein
VNRNERVEVRVSSAERELLDRIADLERVRPSEAVRIVLRAEGRRRGLWPPQYDGDLDEKKGDVA